jgi:hypothetical protein
VDWYSHLTKFAAPKNQIAKYRIADSFLKFFLFKYENLIKYDEIDAAIAADMGKGLTSKDDDKGKYLQQFIKNRLFPILKSQFDRSSEYNNYMKPDEVKKEIEKMMAPGVVPDQQMALAIQVYKQNPERAIDIMGTSINHDKEVSFKGWWEYLTEGEDTYKENPAFAFSVFRPILESSDEKTKDAAPPLNAEALSMIFQEIKDTNGTAQINVLKKYIKESSKIDTASSQTVKSTNADAHWVYIPGGTTDPEHLQENIDKLKRFSVGTGWCVAGGHAAIYLPQGDFWLYILNGITTAAIRCIGNKKIAEIRGHNNDIKNITPYWEPVLDFIQAQGLDPSTAASYPELKKMMLMNAEIAEGDQGKINNILEMIRKDPKSYGMVSQKNKDKFPQFRKAAVYAYETQVNDALDAVENLPPHGHHYTASWRNFEHLYNLVPADIKPDFSSSINARIITVHRKTFQHNPLELEFFPAYIQAQITDQEKYQAWDNFVKEDPYRLNTPQIPSQIRSLIFKNEKQNIVHEWDVRIKQNVEHIDHLPDYIRPFFPPNYLEKIVIDDFMRYPFSRPKPGQYDKLERVQQKQLLTEEQIIKIYADYVKQSRDFDTLVKVPSQYKAQVQQLLQPADMASLAQKSLRIIMADPMSFKTLDPTTQDSLVTNYPTQIANAFMSLKVQYGNNVDAFWGSVPPKVQRVFPRDVKIQLAQYYVPMIRNKVITMQQVPIDLRPFVGRGLMPQKPACAVPSSYKIARIIVHKKK